MAFAASHSMHCINAGCPKKMETDQIMEILNVWWVVGWCEGTG